METKKNIIIKIRQCLTDPKGSSPVALLEFIKTHPQYINYNPMRGNTWVGFPSGFSEAWVKYLKQKNNMTK
jgi:hypothetical protein